MTRRKIAPVRISNCVLIHGDKNQTGLHRSLVTVADRVTLTSKAARQTRPFLRPAKARVTLVLFQRGRTGLKLCLPRSALLCLTRTPQA